LNTPVLYTSSFTPQTPCIKVFQPFSMRNGANIFENHRGAAAMFWAVEADDEKILRLNRPTIAVEGNLVRTGPFSVKVNAWPVTITVTGGTDPAGGAADKLYFTTDGSPPWPGKPATVNPKFAGIQTSAQVYQNPVVLNGPCMFRVRAMKAGYVDSDTQALNLTN
jgi:hypothetical protein